MPISFLVSAVLLASIRSPEPPPPPRADREPVLQEIRVGLSLVAQDPVLRAYALAQMALAGLWGVFGGLWILFAVDELGLGPAAIGIIAGVGGAASFLGAVVAGRVTRRFGIGPVAIWAMVDRGDRQRSGAARPDRRAGRRGAVPHRPAARRRLGRDRLRHQRGLGPSGAASTTASSAASCRSRSSAPASSSSSAALGAGLLAEVVGLRPALFLAPLGAVVGAVVLWASPVRSLVTLPDGKAIGPVDPTAVVADRVRDEPIGG